MLCCKSRRASDRYGILPRKAAGKKDKQGMEHVSAAAVAAAVQGGLHMGSEVKGTAFTSGRGSRTIIRLIWHRSRALWSIGVREIVGHCLERREES
jgi:hypothetical protein